MMTNEPLQGDLAGDTALVATRAADIPLKVTILINMIPPYRLPVFRTLAARIPGMSFLVSVAMEKNRAWQANWENLPVIVQRTITFKSSLKHPDGFAMLNFIHIPYDTLWQLFRQRPDVVVSGEMGMRTVQACLYRLMNRRSRLIVWGTLSDHTEQGIGKIRGLLRRFIVKVADRFLVNGEGGARYFRSLGVSDGLIDRIGQAVDIAMFKGPPTRPPHLARNLILVGQLEPYKGVLPFLEHFRTWAERRPGDAITLTILGQGRLHPQAEEAARTMPANVKIRLLGHAAYDQVPAILLEHGLLIFPSLREEWGLVVNEAMAAGLVIVGSRYSQAVEELVEDGRTGWTFWPDRPKTLFRALDHAFAADPDRLDEMRRAGQSTIAEVTPERMAGRMISSILKNRSNCSSG